MLLEYLIPTLLALSSASASTTCDIDTFTSLLHSCNIANPATVVYAQTITQGGSIFDPSPPFPSEVTNLPELCAVKVQVQSSESSAYNFGIFLPSQWNSRMMTTGNGGFSGGINVWCCPHGLHILTFCTVSRHGCF